MPFGCLLCLYTSKYSNEDIKFKITLYYIKHFHAFSLLLSYHHLDVSVQLDYNDVQHTVGVNL
jgi:hypothetical protein